jgi:predicted ATPase
VLTCLQKDPARRFQHMAGLRTALEALAQETSKPRPLEEKRGPGATPSGWTIPAPRTSFVGREQELVSLRQLILSDATRLVTLTGSGGSGKTRLAMQLAAELPAHFPGGVWFVALAAISDPAAVATEIARALQTTDVGLGSAAELVKRHLRTDRETLLILDNFEHLLPAGPLIAELLDYCPTLKILVTSRVILHLYGEREFPVLPLEVPEAGSVHYLDALARNPAVALFIDRAKAVRADFELTSANAGAVKEICCRLDGLPLAIELSAARVKMLPPAAMAARLQSRLELVIGGPRDAPRRQQTLRSAIEWSHSLLDEPQQTLFRRLSVFSGGFTVESAEAVCNSRRDLGSDSLQILSSLSDHSLIQQMDGHDGSPRFTMLETIREYGLERLVASGEEGHTRRAHAAYCLVLAEEGAGYRIGERSGWLAICDAEHDNLRAALAWLIARESTQWAVRLGLALFLFWEPREYLAEAWKFLSAVLKLPGVANRTREYALLLSYGGAFADDLNTSDVMQREALEIYRELDDKRGVISQLNTIGSAELFHGRWSAARIWFEQSLQACRELGSSPEIAAALSNLAEAINAEGDHAQATALFRQAMAMFRELNDVWNVGWSFNHLGDVARGAGDSAEARTLYAQGLKIFQEIGDLWGLARTLADLGCLARDESDFEKAGEYFRSSLTLFRQLKHKRGVFTALEDLARLAAVKNQWDRSLTLAAAAATLRRLTGVAIRLREQATLDKCLKLVREHVDPATAETAWTNGSQMSLEQAVAYALDGC